MDATILLRRRVVAATEEAKSCASPQAPSGKIDDGISQPSVRRGVDEQKLAYRQI